MHCHPQGSPKPESNLRRGEPTHFPPNKQPYRRVSPGTCPPPDRLNSGKRIITDQTTDSHVRGGLPELVFCRSPSVLLEVPGVGSCKCKWRLVTYTLAQLAQLLMRPGEPTSAPVDSLADTAITPKPYCLGTKVRASKTMRDAFQVSKVCRGVSP